MPSLARGLLILAALAILGPTVLAPGMQALFGWLGLDPEGLPDVGSV